MCAAALPSSPALSAYGGRPAWARAWLIRASTWLAAADGWLGGVLAGALGPGAAVAGGDPGRRRCLARCGGPAGRDAAGVLAAVAAGLAGLAGLGDGLAGIRAGWVRPVRRNPALPDR